MNVLHLSSMDHGGAGIAALRLHEGFRRCGHVSRMLVLDKRSEDPEVVRLSDGTKLFRMRRLAVKAMLKFLSNKDHYFQIQSLSPAIPAQQMLDVGGIRPDAIVVHFISHFLSARDVHNLQAASDAPIIWHLLDMAPLTGGCHYAWSCRKYQSGCHTCPSLYLRSANDLSARIWREKLRYTAATRGIVVAGSSTLAEQARTAFLFRNHRIETVLLGVSPERFRPRNRSELRHAFGVRGSGPIILFGAQTIDQRRKGMTVLREALTYLAANWPTHPARPSILAAGNPLGFNGVDKLGFEYRSLGFVGVETLAAAYAAADVFVCPSIEDSGPLMINEALMCGTPVVAFRMGVAPDLVIPGITGEIANLGDPEALAAAMTAVLSWDEQRHAQASAACRQLAIEKCSADVQLARFIELADSLSA